LAFFPRNTPEMRFFCEEKAARSRPKGDTASGEML
jgi:hypothetical protein